MDQLLERDQDEQAIRAWHDNIAFFGILAVAVIAAVLYLVVNGVH